jgi:hypothetical protein
MPPPNRQLGTHSDVAAAGQGVSRPLKIAAVVLRSVFLITLLVLTTRVSLPQNESIWTVYDTLGDMTRLVLGLMVSVWILYHLFRLPRGGAQGYRTWTYLGIILVPLTLAVIFALW